jgi:Bifunctional DNA primase/polymerase, N-terminal
MTSLTDSADDNNISLKAAALEYARLGYRVFPLAPGTKIPYTNNGHLEATTDLKKVAQWWTWYPWSNIGWRPYEHQKGIDVDTLAGHGKDGLATYVELAGRLGRLPAECPVVVTPSGGLHYWVTCDVVDYRITLGDGVDVKGHKGYTVAPPSIIDKRDPKARVYGSYYWRTELDGEILPWVLRPWVNEIDSETHRARELLDPAHSYMAHADLLPARDQFDSIDRYVQVLKLSEKAVFKAKHRFYLNSPTTSQRWYNAAQLRKWEAEQRKPRTDDSDKRKRALGLLDWRIYTGRNIGKHYAPALKWVKEDTYGGRDFQTLYTMRFLAPLVGEGHLSRAELVDAIIDASKYNEHIPENKTQSFVERQIDTAITKFSHPFDWERLDR